MSWRAIHKFLWCVDLSPNNLFILSTKKGNSISEIENKLVDNLRNRQGLAIVFGSPRYDPDEILEIEGSNLNSLLKDMFLELNSAPMQGVRTIRTYEAVFITLTLINSVLYSKGIT